MMPWPDKIAHGGRGDNRMSFKERNDSFARDNKRRFMRDVVLLLVEKDNQNVAISGISERHAKALAESAERLYTAIEEKVR